MGKKKKRHNANSYSELKEGDAPTNKGRNKGKGGNRQNKYNTSAAGNDFQFRSFVEVGSRVIVDMASDGNCLFRSLADQLYYDYGDNHEEVRSDVCDYIEAKEDNFSVFLVLDDNTEQGEDAANFEEYVSKMREDGEWGGNLELVAASQLYRRNIRVFSEHAAFTIEHGKKSSAGRDLMISYHENDHYNSVRGKSDSKPPVPAKFPADTPKNASSAAVPETAKGEQAVLAAAGNPAKPPRKNDPCHCGSGLRYKKCCLEARKRSARLDKWKAKHEGDVEWADDESSTEMDGQFTVLKI